ncbi:DNA polymerase/3'-5' exonuclease PolX [Salicibibacter halophilus]|uniref:DNA-directed DNA polymerase n=1 Tax=Salicibibacter halophilus TaxID=2502791 RepID=A0A514LGV9_9BACI|nr:DNA polymerase/3'-5' exonuclease PolX [Salicibibacter halophilus]QDI91088.1 DNA polymerase/3'-5' exonuclease PolX [Salicibibacter halophilus]
MDKKEVMQTLETIAIYQEISGENPFKIAAYRKAAQALEREARTLEEIGSPEMLNGIGKGTAAVIESLRDTGTAEVLDELKAKVPAGLPVLLQLPGLGGKKVGKLYQELGITDVASLKQACEQKQVQTLPGFGAKTEEKILEALNATNERPERLPVAFMLQVAEEMEAALGQFHAINRFARAGSLRRLKETVRDLDYVISSDEPERVREQLKGLSDIAEVVADGEKKVSLQLDKGYLVNVDVRIVSDDAFASALHHFTGSKGHHLLMRRIAKGQKEKINEYGVEDSETGKITTFQNEKEFFAHFGLEDIPPEAREGTIETDWFQSTRENIDLMQVKGDLHMHTVWSDGANSIEEMAKAAIERGYTYMAITDHSRFLQVANGLSEARVLRQQDEIRAANEKFDDIRIFSGIEMDIRPDGTLDYSDETLRQLDFVIASIHSAFSQSEATIHARLNAALDHPCVDLIAHPTGRLIGKRQGYSVDLDWLFKRAAETGTALELNANPNRLDLSADALKRAVAQGVTVAINTDAHRAEGLSQMAFGIGTAKKAFLLANQVMNTWPLEKLESHLKNKRMLTEK